MRLPKKKLILISVFVLIASFAVFQVFKIYNSARQILAETRARQDGKIAYPLKKIPHSSPQKPNRNFAKHRRWSGIFRFKNSFFAVENKASDSFFTGKISRPALFNRLFLIKLNKIHAG